MLLYLCEILRDHEKKEDTFTGNRAVNHPVSTGKRSLFSGRMPYRIIVRDVPKSVFMQKHDPEKDLGDLMP